MKTCSASRVVGLPSLLSLSLFLSLSLHDGAWVSLHDGAWVCLIGGFHRVRLDWVGRSTKLIRI